MPASPENVLAALQKEQYAPLYFLSGEENFYLDRISDWIETHALPAEARSFNQSVWYGKDVSLGDVLLQARQFPVMAERQVLIVKEAQEIAELSKDKGKKQLLQYAENPVKSTVLVFVYRHKKLSLKSAFAKGLDKNAVLVHTKKLYDNQVPGWIRQYLKAHGYTATPSAEYMLTEFIGNELARLASELDKLFLNLPRGTQITDELVQKYVGIHKAYNTFEFQKALGQRNAEKAYRIAYYFAANPKAHPVIPLIASLFNYFTRILLIHQSRDKSKSHLAQVLRLPPFVVQEYIGVSRRYSLPKTIRALRVIQLADLQSKGIRGANMSEHETLRELVFRLTAM